MEKYLHYQGKKIYYRSTGSGKPVMFVHGFGEDGNVWNHQRQSLENKFHLLIPDLPGSGHSEMIQDMSIEGMAEVLLTIMHEDHIDRCTVIGHSMGGYITLALAEKYWNHLTAFGLVHSTAYNDSEEKKSARKKGIEFIRQHGATEFLKSTIPNLFSSFTRTQHPDLISDFIISLTYFQSDPLIAYYEAMIKRPERTAVLKNAMHPVLFVAGEQDQAIPLQDSLRQSHLATHCSFHILKKSGHMGMLEEPQELNRILDRFLTET